MIATLAMLYLDLARRHYLAALAHADQHAPTDALVADVVRLATEAGAILDTRREMEL